MEIITRNSIRCRKCGEEIESKSGHDFRWCSCRAVAVDGGREYLRRLGNPEDWVDTSIVETVDDILKRAADVAARIASGDGPTEADLVDAPLLSEWVVALVRGELNPCLVGIVTGHPKIADGRRATTSQLLAIDQSAGWARTISRYYRLGRRAQETEH